jgi:hypothetical protein
MDDFDPWPALITLFLFLWAVWTLRPKPPR